MDGGQIATGSDDKTVVLHAKSGACLSLEGHTGSIFSVTYRRMAARSPREVMIIRSSSGYNRALASSLRGIHLV